MQIICGGGDIILDFTMLLGIDQSMLDFENRSGNFPQDQIPASTFLLMFGPSKLPNRACKEMKKSIQN